jgi:hypothetical protein
MSEHELKQKIEHDNRTTWARLNAEMYALITARMEDRDVHNV